MWLKGDGQLTRPEPEIRYVDREVPVVRLVEVRVTNKKELLIAFSAGVIISWLISLIFTKLI